MIKANLEPLKAQISTLTQLLTQLIQDNSATTNPTTGPELTVRKFKLCYLEKLDPPEPCQEQLLEIGDSRLTYIKIFFNMEKLIFRITPRNSTEALSIFL